jgi:hypothetical protein
MTKTSLTRALFIAGAVALAGAAQAQTLSSDLSSSSVSSDTMSSSSSMSDSNSVDTTTLGAGSSTLPSTSSTTTVTTQYMYVQPNINWDRSTAVSQLHSNGHLMHGSTMGNRTGATATFNVPARAGEASTMTGGSPNALTTNDRVIVGSYVIPYSSVTTSPYYVFSY